MRHATTDESRPPLSEAPTFTSATMRVSTARCSSRRRPSIHSWSDRPSSSPRSGTGGCQYCQTRTRPSTTSRQRPGGRLLHTLEHRARVDGHEEREHLVEAAAIDAARRLRVQQQRLDLGGEDEGVARRRVEERPLPDSIAPHEQTFRACVPQRERKLPVRGPRRPRRHAPRRDARAPPCRSGSGTGARRRRARRRRSWKL